MAKIITIKSCSRCPNRLRKTRYCTVTGRWIPGKAVPIPIPVFCPLADAPNRKISEAIAALTEEIKKEIS